MNVSIMSLGELLPLTSILLLSACITGGQGLARSAIPRPINWNTKTEIETTHLHNHDQETKLGFGVSLTVPITRT